MRLLYWCMLVLTILLLVCEVTVSQLCNSFITLIDGFHSLFILMRMALTPQNPPLSSLDPPTSTSHPPSSPARPPANQPKDSSIQPLHDTQTTTVGSDLPDQPPTAPVHSSLSYPDCRIQLVGDFFSALLLVSLCVSYILEIISCSQEIKPIRNSLTLVEVSVVSLLHKILVLWLNWDQRRASETTSPTGGNPTAVGNTEARGEAWLERLQYDPRQAQSAVDGAVHNGELVFCNLKASIIPGTDCETPEPDSTAPHRNSVSDLKRSADIMEMDADGTCMRPLCKSHVSGGPVPPDPWLVGLLTLVRVVQGLCTSLFALIISLVTLLIGPHCPRSSGTCSFLVYLDPGLSLLAIIVLIATAAPQLHRYGLLLLQATPPHICVSDLASRIASIPRVKGVHELHIWQLNESIMVASVHLHCHAGFAVHRVADVMSGVTEVLQSVGVDFCTIQPELVSCSGSSAGNDEDASPPRLLACSLACSAACSDSMCCSVEDKTLQKPPAGEPKEVPQGLVVENTFHR
ncbi:proton-coupled zinc antiporter SLC30A1 [Antennarius striatus]|uniref:proton-coupled zinc antiporter SLC30A1 n=1 Tax=Antennarius striatus TaxID=241820 RepID=UPI0035ADBF41